MENRAYQNVLSAFKLIVDLNLFAAEGMNALIERVLASSPTREQLWEIFQIIGPWYEEHGPSESWGFFDKQEFDAVPYYNLYIRWSELSKVELKSAVDFPSALSLTRSMLATRERSEARYLLLDFASTPEHALIFIGLKQNLGEGCSEKEERKLLKLATTDEVRLALINFGNERRWNVQDKTMMRLAEMIGT